MKYINLTPQTIGTEDMQKYLTAKFEKLREYQKYNKKDKDECIKLLSSNIIKPSFQTHSKQGNYVYYEIDKNSEILFLKSFNNINLDGKLCVHQTGKHVLILQKKISTEEIDDYINRLYDEYMNIYNQELNRFKNL